MVNKCSNTSNIFVKKDHMSYRKTEMITPQTTSDLNPLFKLNAGALSATSSKCIYLYSKEAVGCNMEKFMPLRRQTHLA